MPTPTDNMLTRVALTQTYDSEPQQTLTADGRYGESFGGKSGAKLATPRLQEYGYSSYAPNGSLGITQVTDGNPDKAMITKLEHPDFRWKNLAAEGNIAEYDKWQHRRLKEQTQWTDKVGTAEVLYQESGGIVHINPPSSIVATWQVHRDGSRMTPDELAERVAMEEEAESQRQLILTEAQSRHDSFMSRIDEMEQRIARLEDAIANKLKG